MENFVPRIRSAMSQNSKSLSGYTGSKGLPGGRLTFGTKSAFREISSLIVTSRPFASTMWRWSVERFARFSFPSVNASMARASSASVTSKAPMSVGL